MTRALLSLANVLIALAASTGSPLMNAMAVGPVNSSSRPVTPASDAARFTRVFLATEYVAEPPRDLRRSARLATVSPRYSVTTVAVDSLNCSVMSATAVALSALAMHASYLGLGPSINPGWVLTPETTNAPGAERPGREDPLTMSTVVPRPPAWAARAIPEPSTDFSVTDGLRCNV